METEKWYKNALMLNRDPCWYRGTIDDSSAEACRKSLVEYFSLYEGAVTDICLCVFEQTALFPSRHFMWRGDKYLQKEENGHPVDYTNEPEKNLYKCFIEYNVDAVQIFIDQMHKLGIRPWLAFRMNDAHFGADPTAFNRSDMFYEEIAAGHGIGEQYGYFAKCFDFRYPRYRTALLQVIGEVLERYDFFGLELDFMRECHCFDYRNDPECHKIMTGYIREIRALVTEAEKRVGHDIKLSIRTCRSPRDAMAFGFDIQTLVSEKLVDLVIPTPRWSPTDSGIPIREWCELLGDKAAVFGGIETNNRFDTINTAEHAKAYAAAFYAQGADGIYFNNHEYYTDRNRASWQITRESCLRGKREFVVTHQDLTAYEEWRYNPFPVVLNGENHLTLEVGKIKAEDKVTVFIDFEGEMLPTLTACDKQGIADTEVNPIILPTRVKEVVLTPHRPIAYDVSGISTESSLPLTFSGTGKVWYVNVMIDAE